MGWVRAGPADMPLHGWARDEGTLIDSHTLLPLT